jgi:hypothetical protein
MPTDLVRFCCFPKFRPLGVLSRAASACVLGTLVACGGGGGAGAETAPAAPSEVLNGISVPLAPDATTNAGTLAGVDSNRNALRDDVERELAQSAATPAQFEESVKVAVAQQALVAQPVADRAAALALLKAEFCATQAAIDAGQRPKDSIKLLTDTPQRRAAYDAAAALAGSLTSDELGVCP